MVPALDEAGDAGERLKAVIEGYALIVYNTIALNSRHSRIEVIPGRRSWLDSGSPASGEVSGALCSQFKRPCR